MRSTRRPYGHGGAGTPTTASTGSGGSGRSATTGDAGLLLGTGAAGIGIIAILLWWFPARRRAAR